MKTRNGFVSNSSSSSFLVGYKKGDHPTITVEIDLTKFSERTIRNEADLLEWLHETTSYKTIEGAMVDSEYRRKEIERIRKAFANGQEVAFIEVSNEDGDEAGLLLYRMSSSDLKKTVKNGEILDVYR